MAKLPCMDELLIKTQGPTLDDRVLEDRLIRVENALFYLKAKSAAFTDWDNSEVERLERMRSELHAMYDEMHSRGAPPSRVRR
jgi:hypothetical protein